MKTIPAVFFILLLSVQCSKSTPAEANLSRVSGKLDDQRLVFLQGGNTGLGVVLIGFFSILNKQFSCNRSQQAQGYGVIGGLTQQHISRESLAVQGG